MAAPRVSAGTTTGSPSAVAVAAASAAIARGDIPTLDGREISVDSIGSFGLSNAMREAVLNGGELADVVGGEMDFTCVRACVRACVAALR